MRVLLILLGLFCFFSAQCRILLEEGFENERLSMSLIKSPSAGVISEMRPASGSYHWIPAKRGMNKFFLSSETKFDFEQGKKYVLSFKVAVEGCYLSHQLGIYLTGSKGEINTSSISVSPSLSCVHAEYRQFLIEYIPERDFWAYLTFHFDNSDFFFEASTILLHYILLLDGIALPLRPEPTFPVVNANKYESDALDRIELFGHELVTLGMSLFDGYQMNFEEDIKLRAGGSYNLDVLSGSGSREHILVCYMDLNNDGDWSDPYEEQAVYNEVRENESSRVKLNLPNDMATGHYVLRLRYLYEAQDADPLSGAFWGSTYYVVVTVVNDRSKISCTGPCNYFDMSGRMVRDLNSAPVGIYIRRCGQISEKTGYPTFTIKAQVFPKMEKTIL